MTIELEPLPFEEALDYFRAKGYALQPTGHWTERWQEDHAAMFTVARTAGFDVLQDIYDAVQRAQSQGLPFRDFQKQMTPILQAKGWWGKKLIDGEAVQLGSPRRLRIIYDTNLRMAAASGSWARIERTVERRPYLRYVAILDSRTRADHRRWHGTVLRADDPWWDTHYPPCGWRCRCTVQQLGPRDLDRYGYSVTKTPPNPGTRIWTNPRTGQKIEVPIGVDPGFAYHKGKAALDQQAARTMMARTADAPPDLGAAMGAAAKFVAPALARDFAAWTRQIADQVAGGDFKKTGERRVIGTLSETKLAHLRKQGIEPASSAITVSDSEIIHALRDAKKSAGKAPPIGTLQDLPGVIAEPTAVLWDKINRNFIIVTDVTAEDATKIVINIDRVVNLAPSADRSRAKIQTNTVQTAQRTPLISLRDRNQYDVIQGNL